MREFETEAEVAEYRGRTIEFRLRGQTFIAKPVLDLRGIANYFAAAADEAGGNTIGATIDAIRKSLVNDEERVRWDEVIGGDYDVPIRYVTVESIFQYLIEETTRRPTQPSARSGLSNGSAGTPSTAVSSSPPAAASPSSL